MDPGLAALGEFGLIGLIRKWAAPRSPGAILGIGDDAALLAVPDDRRLLVTTDMLLEGVHFQRRWGCPRELGRKALAVNISDIAAMGGDPLYALLGMAPSGPVPLRAGARPGDGLWVTGLLGGSAAGLAALELGLRPGAEWPVDLRKPAWLGAEEYAAIQAAMMAHLTPTPRIGAGQALVGCATAMIDVSDGVASDVGHLCTESGMAARVLADQLPLHPGAMVMARLTGRDVLDLALRGGEDYELLFTTATDPAPLLAGAAPDLRVTRIGDVLAGEPIPRLVLAGGREEPLAGGFDHLREPAR